MTTVTEHAVNGVPETPTAGPDTASVEPAGQHTSSREIPLDGPRLRLLAASALGVGCLLLAQRLGAGQGQPLVSPSGPVAWTAVFCGIAGIWLVPGLWLSAMMVHSGAGPVARLATWIGTTLAWYALVGPVDHLLGRGARVTTAVIMVVTVAATAAVCLGVALALLRRPADPRLRILLAAVVGGICAQTVILLSMRLWTYDMNYEHIRRLDWLIVLAAAFLTTVGMQGRPELPSVRTVRDMRTILVFLAVIAITGGAARLVGGKWSPDQRMPSAFSVEQVAAPPSADIAFVLTALGPDGFRLIQRADFTASDDTGRPVSAQTRLVADNGSADRATLLVQLDRSRQLPLCKPGVGAWEQDRPVKLTLRDKASGVLVQGIIPARWCAG